MDERTKKALQEIVDSLLSRPPEELRQEFEQHTPGYFRRIYTENNLTMDSGSHTIDLDSFPARTRSAVDHASFDQRWESYVSAGTTGHYRMSAEGDSSWMTAA